MPKGGVAGAAEGFQGPGVVVGNESAAGGKGGMQMPLPGTPGVGIGNAAGAAKGEGDWSTATGASGKRPSPEFGGPGPGSESGGLDRRIRLARCGSLYFKYENWASRCRRLASMV